METPDASTLLRVWERGTQQSAVNRGLLLLAAVFPERPVEQLASFTLGERDSALLSLRERLFGARIECLTRCDSCGENIELDFGVDGIRAEAGRSDAIHEVEVDGAVVSFRLPNSLDLRAIEAMPDESTAQRALLARCVVGNTALPLTDSLASAIDARMSEADAQAQVQLAIGCPACKRDFRAPFFVPPFLWSEIERWARAILRDVHVLASVYGWTEPEVLALGNARRRAYLEMVGAV